MIGTDSEKESGNFVLSMRLDDDDDIVQKLLQKIMKKKFL